MPAVAWRGRATWPGQPRRLGPRTLRPPASRGGPGYPPLPAPGDHCEYPPLSLLSDCIFIISMWTCWQLRLRRSSAEEAASVYTDRARKLSHKQQPRRKQSEKYVDPFNNLKMERFWSRGILLALKNVDLMAKTKEQVKYVQISLKLWVKAFWP